MPEKDSTSKGIKWDTTAEDNKPSASGIKWDSGEDVKKKGSSQESQQPVDDGTQTLNLSDVVSGKQKVLPSQSGGSNKFSLTPGKEMKKFSLSPVEKGIVPKKENLNEQGLIGDGAKKSNVLKAVDAQLDEHMPVTNEETKKLRESANSSIQKNDIPAILGMRDAIVGKHESDVIKAQDLIKAKTFINTPVGQPMPIDLKLEVEAEHEAVKSATIQKIDQVNNIFNELARNAIVDKHLNPPDADAKAALSGFDIDPAISKELYQSIGKDFDKYKLPRTGYNSGNTSYDQTREGVSAVINSTKQEANDLISFGKEGDNPEVLKRAQEKADEIAKYQNVLNNLDNDYPDVQVQKTARYLSDIMYDMNGFRFTTSREDVMAAAKVAQEKDPTFMKKYGKYVEAVAESEGTGMFGQMASGMIGRDNIAAQLDQSLKQWTLERAGDVASLVGDKKVEGIALAGATDPLLGGTSRNGGARTKIIIGENGTFVEKANEDYGKISFNNGVRSFTHAVPGLLEWITAEKAIGGVVGELAAKAGRVVEAGQAASSLSSLGVGGGLTESALSVGAEKAAYNQAAGLVGATYISGYEGNRRIADSVIDDNTGWGEAKKMAFAHLMTLSTAGVFHMLNASPNKIIQESFANTIKKDVISVLEKNNFKDISSDELHALLENKIFPKAAAYLKSAGLGTVQSLKEGATMAAAGDVSNKLNQLAVAIVNPSKADFGTMEENFNGFIGQAFTMSLFPALGRIVSKGGYVPYMAKDALYDAAMHDGIVVDDVRKKMDTGEYSKDQGSMMIKLLRSYKESIVEASLQTTKEGTPLSTKQAKDWATADFRLKIKDLFAQEGKPTSESIDNEVKISKDDATATAAFHKVEDSEIFKSATPVSDEIEKPVSYLDIEPNRMYTVTIDGKEQTVTGETLQNKLTDENTYKGTEEDISKPIELRPEITQGNLTDEEFSQLKELEAKQNPVIENGKVVKPGVALGEEDQNQYDKLVKKSQGEVYTQEDFKGLRDDDFAKKYLTEREYNNWHELDKRDDPEAKKIIADRKQELLSQKKTTPAEVKPEEKGEPASFSRHSETPAETYGTDKEQITPEGLNEASKLGKTLPKGTDIVVSDMPRSIQTGEAIADETGGKITQDPLIREHDPKTETTQQLAERAKKIQDKYGDKKGIHVVTHGEVLAMMDALDKSGGDIAKAVEMFDKKEGKTFENNETYKVQQSAETKKPATEKSDKNKPEAKEEKVTPAQHKENIHTKFRKEFEGKGIPKEQVDAAIALMEARAKSWASEEKGRNADDWYERIADVKGGEFQSGTPRQYQEQPTPMEGVAYHGDTGKEKSSGYTYLADKDVAESYAEDNGGKVRGVKYKLDNPFVVDSDAKSKIISDLVEEFQKNNPKSKWHPDTTTFVNDRLKQMGYDGLVIKKEALDSEYGYDKIGGTYGDPQIVLFPKAKSSDNEVEVYHGGGVNSVKDLAKGEPLFVSEDYNQAREYTRENEGTVTPFKIDKSKIADEQAARDIIKKLGLRPKDKNWEADELNLFELIDPRFDTSLSPKNIKRLFGELEKNGYEGVSFMDTNLKTDRQDIENIAIFDPKKTLFKKDGQPLFQKDEAGKPKGAVETLADGKKVIHAMNAPDFSTMVHELAHVFEGDLTPEESRAVKSFGGSEPFARGFEKYLRDGNAPTPEMKSVFEKFKQWLTDIYHTLKGSPIEKEITPEIKQIFDRLLTEIKSKDSINKIETNAKFAEQTPTDTKEPVSQGGNKKGTRVNGVDEETATFVRGEDGSNGKNASRKEQESKLEEFSKKKGTWYGDKIIEEPNPGHIEPGIGTFIDSGTESQVYESETDPNKVVKTIKVNDPQNPEQTISDFLDKRIGLHNDFAETVPYKLLGFGKNENGELVAIVEQPYVKNATEASKEEIRAELEKRGWKGDKKGTTFENDTHILTDMKGANVLKDEQGNLHFIDTKLDTKEVPEQKAKEVKEKTSPPLTIPPIPPVRSLEDIASTPGGEWTAIRKEKQMEIDAVKQAYENQGRKDWSTSMKNGLEKIQTLFPDKNLYDAALSHMRQLNAGGGLDYLTPDESLATLQYLKREIGLRRSSLVDAMVSGDDAAASAALIEDASLYSDFVNTALAIKDITTTAGRTLVYAQSELGIDPEYGLSIRRMELAKAKGGQALTDEDLEATAASWEKEKELFFKEQQLREDKMQQQFDQRIEKMQKEFESGKKTDKAPTSKERKDDMLKKSGKDLADKLRSVKITGAKSDPLLFATAFNAAVDVIAFAVENGATLAQAIKNYIDENKIKDGAKFQRDFLDTLDRQDKKAETFGKIKEFAEAGKLTDVTNELVGKNLIRDYVNSQIGSMPTQDILEQTTNELKEVFPGLTKQKLTEAYLKEGEFRQKTSKQLSKTLSDVKKELVNIAKLTEDIEDLEGYKQLRTRSFANPRERSEYEASLEKQKNDIIAQRKEADDKFRKEYTILETERNRQLAKEAELTQKIEDAKQLFKSTQPKGTPEVDTPAIEALKKQLADTKKETAAKESEIIGRQREAEKEQKRYDKLQEELDRVTSRTKKEKTIGAADKFVPSEREKEITAQIKSEKEKWDKEKEAAAKNASEYKKLETERNRQLQKIQDLTDKLGRLQQGVRDVKNTGTIEKDTAEIEDLKKQVSDLDKALSKKESEAKAKAKKIAEINDKINQLNDKGELAKKVRKNPEKIDDDISAKKEELRKLLVSKGLKTSSDDKYKKASYVTRADAHNSRIDAMKTDLMNAIIDPNTTPEQKKVLDNLLNRLDMAKVVLDPNSALSQSKVLDHAAEVVKGIKAEFDKKADKDIVGLGKTKMDLNKIVDSFVKDKDNAEQDVKLARAKDKMAADKAELERKLNAGEFEDNQPVELTKYDAELIKLQRDRDAVRQEYEKRKHQYEKDRESGWKRAGQFGRALWVTALIYKGVTAAKVASSAFFRPNLEALTKVMFGKAYEQFISPSIAAKAKEGGEGSSLVSIRAGYMAFLGHLTEADIQKKYVETTKKFEDLDAEYRAAQNTMAPDSKKLQTLKNKRDAALVENMSSMIYQYINPSAYKEVLEVFLHRSADIEATFGDFGKEEFDFAPKNATAGEKLKKAVTLDNLEHFINFVGRSHSALKTFSGRQSFASSFVARLEHSVNEGVDVNSPDKMLEIAFQSYMDWDRGKYQQKNIITDTWNSIISKVDKVNPQVAYALSADVPITRVPVNQLWEALSEYTVGAFTSSWKTAKAHYDAKGIALKEGYSPKDVAEFKEQIKKNISENLSPDEAATIIRCFRKGGFGLGVYALAVIGGVSFGGFPHKGQAADDKKMKKIAEDSNTEFMKTGEIKIGNMEVPEVFAKIMEHTPALYPGLFGVSLAKVYENKLKLGESTPEAIKDDAIAHVNNILNSIPQYKVFSPIIGDFAQSVKSKFLEMDGVDTDGNMTKLKPFRMSDYKNLLPGIGDKTQLLTPENYKEATSITKNYKSQMADVENNANLTKEDKEMQKKDLERQMDQEIDAIYERQKQNQNQ